MYEKNWYKKSSKSILEELNTSSDGLSKEEVIKRQN